MAYLDNQCNPLDNQESPNIAHCVWMRFSTMDQNKMWQHCSGKCIKWTNDGGQVAFEVRGSLGLALSIAGTADSADTFQHNNMHFTAAEVERVLGGILNVMPHKSYDTWPALLDAAKIAFQKMPAEDQASLAFQGAGLQDCVGAPLPHELSHLKYSEDWEDLITYGQLNRHNRAAAGFLERAVIEHRSVYVECPALRVIARTEVAKGRLDQETLEQAESTDGDDDLDEDERDARKAKVARIVCAAIGRAASLPACLSTHPHDADDVLEMLVACVDGAQNQFDGDSNFMRERSPGIVATVAPTLHLLLHDAHDYSELNAYAVELASSCPKDTVDTDTKRLLTVAGFARLERHVANFASWAQTDTTKTMHIRARVEALTARIDSHIKSGGHSRSARRAHPAAHRYPASPTCAVLTPAHRLGVQRRRVGGTPPGGAPTARPLAPPHLARHAAPSSARRRRSTPRPTARPTPPRPTAGTATRGSTSRSSAASARPATTRASSPTSSRW